MNTTPKSKTQRLEIRVTPENKKKIERYASKCGLSTSEYVTKRALGFRCCLMPFLLSTGNYVKSAIMK